MGKEQDLIDYIFKQDLTELKGNPHKILQLIDEYPESFMTIGSIKGKAIVDKIQQLKPKVMAELGCYVGYSALLFGAELAKHHGKYFSFEVNSDFAALAQKLVDLAGLSKTVEIVVGPAATSLVEFADKGSRDQTHYKSFDVIFVDHWKDLYVPDVRVLESMNLIAPGTLIVGDNILYPGAPEFKYYMAASPQERREYNYEHENVNGRKYIGRWNFVYETEFVPFELDGWKDEVCFSKCVEYLNT